MKITLKLVLLLIALLCFLLAALGIPSNRIGLTPLGLFLWLLSTIVA